MLFKNLRQIFNNYHEFKTKQEPKKCYKNFVTRELVDVNRFIDTVSFAEYKCPCCKRIIAVDNTGITGKGSDEIVIFPAENCIKYPHCQYCGQVIDWKGVI